MSERIQTRGNTEGENISRVGLGTEFEAISVGPTDRQVTEIGSLSLRALEPFEVTGLGSLEVTSEVTGDGAPADLAFRQSHTTAGLTKTCCC